MESFIKIDPLPKLTKRQAECLRYIAVFLMQPQRLSNSTGNSSRDGYSFKHCICVYGTAAKKGLSHINKKYWEEKYSADRTGI